MTGLLIIAVLALWAAAGAVAGAIVLAAGTLARRRGEDSEAEHFAAVAEITRQDGDWDIRELIEP